MFYIFYIVFLTFLSNFSHQNKAQNSVGRPENEELRYSYKVTHFELLNFLKNILGFSNNIKLSYEHFISQ
jgi:hypothetical protein